MNQRGKSLFIKICGVLMLMNFILSGVTYFQHFPRDPLVIIEELQSQDINGRNIKNNIERSFDNIEELIDFTEITGSVTPSYNQFNSQQRLSVPHYDKDREYVIKTAKGEANFALYSCAKWSLIAAGCLAVIATIVLLLTSRWPAKLANRRAPAQSLV